MKKIILSMGLGLFLLAFSMHVKTAVDSPMGLVTQEALAQGGTSGACGANGPTLGCRQSLSVGVVCVDYCLGTVTSANACKQAPCWFSCLWAADCAGGCGYCSLH